MTSHGRPDLSGLFNGSTPADRTSSIAGRLGPRLVVPIDGTASRSTPADADPAAARRRNGRPAADTPSASQPAADQRSVVGWLDPVRAVQLYFGFLQALLDANRDFAVTVTEAIVRVPRRLR